MSVVVTVLGEISAEQFGRALVHEHVLCDFIGAEQTGPHRWNRDEVLRAVLPHLRAVREDGFQSFVDCTPAYIGRDPLLLQEASRSSGLHLLTNTGFYKEPYLPPRAFEQSADQLADEWTREFERGIGDSGIRPGFIKIAVNPGPLIPVQQKIVRAAARTQRRTGMVIACHTGHGVAALETLALLDEEGVSPDRYIFVHADSEADRSYHLQVAQAGGWVEYDAVGWRPIAFHVDLLRWAREAGIGDRILLSQDAGWYQVGEPGGGEIRPYTTLADRLLPAAEEAGIPRQWMEEILTTHAQRAFALRI